MTRMPEPGPDARPGPDAGQEMPCCRLCGASGGVLYRGLRDAHGGLQGSFIMRRCSACGLLWLDPQPCLSDGQKFPYKETEPAKGLPKGDPGRPLAFLRDGMRRAVLCGHYGYRLPGCGAGHRFLGRFLGLSAWIREKATWGCGRLFPPAPPAQDALVIDVGCGEGDVLGILKSLGWRVLGIEPQPQAAATARGRGIEVVEKTLDRVDLPQGRADWLILNHVLEHVPDPQASLGAVFRLLKPAGTLAVRVPNASSLGHRWFGRHCYHLDPPRHLFGYSPKSVGSLFSRFSFSRVRMRSLCRVAGRVYDVSARIRRHGKIEMEVRRRERGRSAFVLLENLACLLGFPVGEELEVIATK